MSIEFAGGTRAWRRALTYGLATFMTAALIGPFGTQPAQAAPVIAFEAADDLGVAVTNPTSIEWGPDERLYVALQNGVINVYDVSKSGSNFSATLNNARSTSEVKNITNHDDDGGPHSITGQQKRLLTGILVAGTASNPVIYATSSDPRIGGGPEGENTAIDTNSGVVSKLTWTGSGYTHQKVVQGLPRSEENHGPNGLALSQDGNTLYVAQGGNTNNGAPSAHFANLPEYALSSSILSIDLDAFSGTCNLATIQDGTTHCAAGNPAPWGGEGGANQAKKINSSPVKVFAPGFRNPYDVIVTSKNKIYSIDNGGNQGWGNVPINEGPAGNCTNVQNLGGPDVRDNLHLISGSGYYAGHPNPTRGNPGGSGFAAAVVGGANPIECDYQAPAGTAGGYNADNSLVTFDFSTNSITEYTASTFGGAMTGDLLTVEFSFNGDTKVLRVDLDGTTGNLAAGCDKTQDSSPQDDCVQDLLTPGQAPLGIVALGDDTDFPGVVFVANYAEDNIVAFEPIDNFECDGTDSPNLDEDNDGYDNADEIDNGSNPCSAGDTPADWDKDKTSDLNDPDDDNDGINDVDDAFAVDAQNGTGTGIPVSYGWENEGAQAGGLLGLGFTGLMTNGHTDYLDQYDPTKMTTGGAAGVLTVNEVTDGDALGSLNSQDNGFQFGFVPVNERFSAHTRLVSPFGASFPRDFQSFGLFVGTGTQNDYVKVTAAAGGGAGAIETIKEAGGTVQAQPLVGQSLPGPDVLDLWLTVDPQAKTVQASYSVNGGKRLTASQPVTIPSSWLSKPMAVGLISTSAGAPTFNATWDFIEVARDDWTSSAPPGPPPPPPTGGTGAFTDIGGSIFQTEINWLAATGITKGCNPPDNTMFCPKDFVTRGQMAAFLHRALEGILTPGEATPFTDDDSSVFEADIEWLAATKVTLGCNPPANTEFCPEDPVTRGQMAAFLHRALEDILAAGEVKPFTDDDSSVFEADIEWLGATGVTKGCNPPANTEFCPEEPVTREQMAAFLYRSLGPGSG